jgi:hypothetical protein
MDYYDIIDYGKLWLSYAQLKDNKYAFIPI